MIPKTIIGVQVEGADKAASELNKVAKANQHVEDTANNSKSIDTLGKKFDNLSDSVGKGMSKLNDIGDMFKIVGIFAGGAAFGGLADIVDVLGQLGSVALTLSGPNGSLTHFHQELKNAFDTTDKYKKLMSDIHSDQVKFAEDARKAAQDLAAGYASAGFGYVESQKRFSDPEKAYQFAVREAEKTETRRTSLEKIVDLRKVEADLVRQMEPHIEDGVMVGATQALSNRLVSVRAEILDLQKLWKSALPSEDANSNRAQEKAVFTYWDKWLKKGTDAVYDFNQTMKKGLENMPSAMSGLKDYLLGIANGFVEKIQGGTSEATKNSLKFFEELLSRGRRVEELVGAVETAINDPEANFSITGDTSSARDLSRSAVKAAQSTDPYFKAKSSIVEFKDTGNPIPLTEMWEQYKTMTESVPGMARKTREDMRNAFALDILSGDADRVAQAYATLASQVEGSKVTVTSAMDSMADSSENAFLSMMNNAANIGSVIQGTVGMVTNAVGSMVTNLIISGDAGAKSIAKSMGNALAGLSAQAFGYAVFLSALGVAAALTGPVLGWESPALFAGAGVMAGAGAALGLSARLLGADQIGQTAKSSSGAGSKSSGSGTSLSSPYKPDVGETKVTVIIGGEVVTRGVKTETRRQNLRGGITEGRMAMAT